MRLDKSIWGNVRYLEVRWDKVRPEKSIRGYSEIYAIELHIFVCILEERILSMENLQTNIAKCGFVFILNGIFFIILNFGNAILLHIFIKSTSYCHF